MLNKLQAKIGYSFKDGQLLKTALTHSSFANENGTDSYEQLEFLGDAVIELVVSDYLYKGLKLSAGMLSKVRASLVSTTYLCNISNQLQLREVFFKSKSLNNLSDKTNADLFESLIGAIYLDGGIDIAKKLINKYIIINKENIENALNTCVDYKTKVQEMLQAKGIAFKYELVDTFGQDHNKTFRVRLLIDNETVATCRGKSIQLAEEKCAENYIKNLKY